VLTPDLLIVDVPLALTKVLLVLVTPEGFVVPIDELDYFYNNLLVFEADLLTTVEYLLLLRRLFSWKYYIECD
jgi:hypothetical protein